MKQTEHHHVAKRDVREQQQGPIAQARAPRRDRVDAECRRAPNEDLETVTVEIVGWGHAASARKNNTTNNAPTLGGVRTRKMTRIPSDEDFILAVLSHRHACASD